MNRSWRIMGFFVCLLALLLLPFLGVTEYYLRLIDVAGIYVVLALGLNIIVGLAGQMSFAHAGFFAIGSYSAALLAVKWGAPFWVGFIGAGIVAAVFAVVVGLPTLKLETKYLSMATIGFSEIVRLVLLNTPSISYGADGIRNIPYPQLGSFVFNTDTRLYFFIMFFAIAAIVATGRLKDSRIGRAFEAIKENTLGAELMGVKTTYNKVLAFTLSAIFTALGGALYAHLMAYISPDAYGFGESAKVLCMVFLGGVGTVAGPVLGAFILTFLPEVLRGLQQYYMVIYAIGVIIILIFAPSGLVGLAKTGLHGRSLERRAKANALARNT
jgi:branched-chain amino acid transport system permease protein